MAGSNLVPVDQLKIKDNQYGTDGAGLPAYQREFIQRFAPYAMLASAQSGIPARFLLAEASIETNWGQSKGAREDNNLFGIKATQTQIAAGVPVSYRDTGENAANGAAYTEKAAPFIKYSSPEAGFNGFVEKLNKTRWADQKALLKHTAENPYAQDNDVETALAGAFARTSYLTADRIDQTMLDRMARMPSDLNVAGFKTAPDFNKATTDLASIAPFDPAQARNVSAALGDFTDNDYVSPNGIPITARPRELNALDRFSDGITEGIEGAGAAVGNTFSGFGNAIRGAFGIGAQASGGTTPTGPAPGDYDFANGGTPGGIGDASFGFGLTPGRNIDANGNAHQGGVYDLDPNGPGGFGAGTDVSGGVGNGTFFGLGGLTGGGAGTGGALPATPAPTLAPPPGTSTINSMYEAILRRPGDAAGLQAFDAQLDSGKMDLNQIQAMLRGSEEAKTLGPLGEARTYSPLETVFARQLDRAPDAQAIQNWGTAQNIDPVEAFVYGSPEAQTYRASLGDTASLIRNPSTAPTIGPGATTGPIGPFGFTGTFKPSEYLKANTDVAAAGMDALTHYATYGYNEGRALDTAGHRINQGFDAGAYLAGNRDVAAAGLDPLEHYVQYGAAEGRALPTGSTAPYQFSGANVSQGAGNGSFSGTFDGAAYLKQNGDVAAAGMNPLDHYLRYGFAEGRAIDPSGTTINQGFDPSAYLQQNRDVADAKLDPLAHYVTYGAHEGRAAPTGSNPYSFSNFNVAQGAGPLGNGTFGFGGATSSGTGGGSAPSGSSIPSFGFGQNVSQNVGPGSFGAGITPSPSPSPSISSFGFSGANVSGGLGATAQGLGGSYAVGSAADLGLGGSGGGASDSNSGTVDPYGFGGDVSGFNVNAPGGGSGGGGAPSTGYDDGSLAAAGFDEKGSELAFLRGQEQNIRDMNESAKLFGQQITNVAPGNQTNYALGAINTPIAPIQQTPFTPVNMSGVFAPPPTIAFMPRFAG